MNEKNTQANKSGIIITIVIAAVAIVLGIAGGVFAGKAKERAAAEAFLAEVESLTQEAKDYYNGTDTVAKDLDKAGELFAQVAEKGNEEAYYYIGRIAEEAEDYATAKENYEKVLESEKVSDLARLALGQLYQRGNGVDVDYAKAKEYYEAAVANGCVEANNGLGDLYQQGYGVEQDGAKAIEYFTLAMEGAEKEWIIYAYSSLGTMYRGEYPNVEQDYAKAMEWYEKAYELGDGVAMSNIGALYRDGKGVEQDSAKAMECFEKAIEAGDSNAFNYIGVMYYDGKGVEQDYAKGVEWFEKGIEQGNATSMSNIANAYKNGNGVEQDYAKAKELFEKGAEKEDG